MKFLLLTSLLFSQLCFTACSQSSGTSIEKSRLVGGPCEGCEAILESPVPLSRLNWTDTLPDYFENGPKIEIYGVVYSAAGKPAKDVVLYVYHTDQGGRYSGKENETGWGRRHGYIRGWVKTNDLGEYKFYTLKPASYPNTTIPAHIHPVIKEPGLNEYWIDEYLFDQDPMLTKPERSRQPQHGGSGIITLVKEGGLLRGKRDIYLGKNIPDYPLPGSTVQSGLALGADCPAFDPVHLSGSDKGKKACPMCKYGSGQGIMVWFNHSSLERLKYFAVALEKEMVKRTEKNLRVFLVYMNPFYKQNDEEGLKVLQAKITKWCELNHLTHIAMVYVPSPYDSESCGRYRINPAAENTVLVYKKRKVTNKWVNIKYDEESVKDILLRF